MTWHIFIFFSAYNTMSGEHMIIKYNLVESIPNKIQNSLLGLQSWACSFDNLAVLGPMIWASLFDDLVVQ